MTPIETILKFTNELLAGIRDSKGMYFVGQRIGLLAVQQIAQELVDNGATAEIREEAAHERIEIHAVDGETPEITCKRVIASAGLPEPLLFDNKIHVTTGGKSFGFCGTGESYFDALVDLLCDVNAFAKRNSKK